MKPVTRNSNIELLRIVSMLGIILSHYMYFGVMEMHHEEPLTVWGMGSAGEQYGTACGVLGMIGVGTFFMITGYYGINRRHFTIRKVILSSVFWGVSSVLLAAVCHFLLPAHPFSETDGITFLRMLLIPVTGSVWWYVTAYIVLIMVSPWLNHVILKMNRRGWGTMLAFLYLFCYVLGNLGTEFHNLEKGIFFYCIGAWCRLSDEQKEKKSISGGVFLAGMISGILLNGFLYCLEGRIRFSSAADAVTKRQFISTLIALEEPFTAFCVFRVFLGLKMSDTRWINRIASCTFGVYLFHEAPLTRILLWDYLVKPADYFGKPVFVLYTLVSVMAIFLVGIFIDAMRQKFVEPHMNQMVDRLERICRS